MPKVTIALITYNRKKYLESAINGILNQTYSNYELIIMDNGSNYDVNEIIEKYTNNKITLLRNQINDYNFINKAFEISKGEYLIVTHDDDIMMPKLIAKSVEILEGNKEIVCVSSNTKFIDSEGNFINNKLDNNVKDIEFSQYNYIKSYYKKNFSLTFPSTMMRLKFFRENNLYFEFDKGPAADNYLWFKLNLLNKKIYFVSEPHYYYRIHNQQDSKARIFDLEFLLYMNTIKLLEKYNLHELIAIVRKSFKTKWLISSLINNYTVRKIDKLNFETNLKYFTRIGMRKIDFGIKNLAKLSLFECSPYVFSKIKKMIK